MAEEATETTETTETTEQTASTEATEPATEETKPNGKETATEPVTETDPDDWRAPIKDEKLRDHAGRFVTVEDMARQSLELRQTLSSAIKPLGTNPTDEQVAEFRKAIGVPETHEGYEFAMPEGQEATDGDKAFQANAAETFHRLNIPADTAKGLNEWWNGVTAATQQELIAADKKYADESEAALKAEWPGKEFDRNKAFADGAVTKLFGDELDAVREIETKGGRFVLDHPAFVKAFAGIGREMNEGRLGGVLTEGDRDNVQGQIDEMEKMIEKATNEGDGEKANKLYQEQQGLYRKIHGPSLVVGAEGRVV